MQLQNFLVQKIVDDYLVTFERNRYRLRNIYDGFIALKMKGFEEVDAIYPISIYLTVKIPVGRQ
jgi:hypothetical protein